jgi:PAS domain S-box-containing protein
LTKELTKVDQEPAVKMLIELGLTPIDARVYLFLEKKGPKKGKELLSALKLNRQQLYRSLKNLQSKGVVSSTLERPAQFSSIPSEQIVDMVIKNKVNEASQLQHRRAEILSILQLAEIRERKETSTKFTVIEGENYIFTKIRQMVIDTKKQIWFSASGLSIIQAETADIIRNTIELEVPFKILTNVTLKNLSIVEKAMKEIVDSEKCKGKHIQLDESLFPKFVIRDDNEMIFLISKDSSVSSVKNDVGLWTNSKPLIDAFKTFFEVLWRDAKDIKKRISELKTGEVLPETIFIRDSEEAYQKYLDLNNLAQNDIILMTSAKGLKNTLDQKFILNGWHKRNVTVRIMAPITKENEDVARELSKYCSIRHVQIDYLGELIVDNNELLQFKTVPPDSSLPLPSTYFDNSFYTNDPEYVQGRRKLLDELWTNSPGIIEELKRSEARFRSLFESSFDAILLTKPDGSILSANPAACHMFGLTEEEIQRTGRDGLLVLDKRALAALLDREKTSKGHAEITLKRKDGSTFEAEVTSSLFTDADGTAKTSMIIRDIAERKKREKELLQFSAAIKASSEGIIIGDLDGNIIDVNEAVLKMYGTSSKDYFIGKHVSDFLVEEDRAIALQDSLSYIKRDHGDTNEYRALRKNGSDFFIEATVAFVRDETGKKVGFVDIIRDITNRKEAEKSLKENKERLEVAQRVANVGSWEYSVENDEAIWSAELFRIFGLKPEQKGPNVVEYSKLIQPDDLKELKTRMDRFLGEGKMGETLSFDYRITKPNGSIRNLHTERIISAVDENDKAKQIVGIEQDITERMQAAKRFETIIRTAMDCFLMTDVQGRFLEANEAYCRLTGYSRKELLTMCISDVEAAETSEETAKHMQQVMANGYDCFEAHHKCKDGRIVDLEHSVNYLMEDGGGRFFVFARDLSERKMAEEALRKSEVWKATSLYARNLIEASLDPLVTIDAEGKITDANKATEEVTGYSKDQLIGSDFSSYFIEPEKAKDGYKRVFANSIVKDFQLAIKHKSGKITDVIYNATVFRNEKGQIQGIFAAARDITERNKAEKILDKKQQELNCILDSSPTIIFYKDREGKFIQANRAFAEALKTTKEKLLGKTVFDLYSVEIAQGMTNDDIEVYRSKSAKLGKVEPYESPTGLRWLKTDKVPIFDETGALEGLIGFSEDITERKQFEEALISSERRYSELFQSMTEMFFVVEPIFNKRANVEDFVYVEANPEFLRSVGKTWQQVVGNSSKKLFGYVDGLWLDTFNSIARTGQPVHVENLSKITNRYYKIYAWKINGKRLGVLCEDITRHRDIERQLQDNERMAAIGKTAGMVGHDLRNPLQTIMGDVYLAETELKLIPKSEHKHNLQKSLQAIASQISYMNKIVSDLQTFAKPVIAKRQVINLSQLIISLLTQLNIPKDIQTSIQVNDKLIVNADPELLKRVFINLTTNALQAMPKGGKLTIKAQCSDSEQVQVSVEDTGVGIPEDIKNKIFTPLFTTKPMGQGFGLAVCKRVIEAQGGHVSFESKVGRGTKFIVSLPV